jgi:hypothetical protein
VLRKVFLVVAAVSAFGVMATPSGAQEHTRGTADLGVTADVIKAQGAERTVRVTAKNYGPDEAYTGDPYEGFDPQINIEFVMNGAVLLSTSIPCSDNPNNVSEGPGRLDRICPLGRSLPAGASRSVDVRVRVTTAGLKPYGGSFTGAVSMGAAYYDPCCGERSASADPDHSNMAETFYWASPPGCKVKVKNPQKATSKGLQVRVVAPAGGGCTAKLKNAKLTIGKKKYVFIKKRPQRKVAAGKTWKLALHYGAGTLSTIRRAVQNGTKVSASVEFDIDGTIRRGKARLK